jgi:hypothetical protein
MLNHVCMFGTRGEQISDDEAGLSKRVNPWPVGDHEVTVWTWALCGPNEGQVGQHMLKEVVYRRILCRAGRILVCS